MKLVRKTHIGFCVACLAPLVASPVARSSDEMKGSIKADGSSTVAPISMMAAEMFQKQHPGVHVTVGISGTGGGFKKFLDSHADLRTDISDASRPIEATELAKAKQLGVQFIEVPLAWDGISVVIHPSNTFCDHLTVEELKKIWEPGSKINNWKDVRSGFPDLPLRLYGPGTDSGTFDYFTEVIVGKEKASRSDYTPSENDNVLVQGVAGDKGSLGYFGFAYYEANKSKIKAIGIGLGSERPIMPSVDSIRDGSYKPLSRPLFLYINAESWKRPEVQSFVEFVYKDPKSIVEHKRVGYVSLPEAVYDLARQRLKDAKTGSAMEKAPSGSRDLAEIFKGS